MSGALTLTSTATMAPKRLDRREAAEGENPRRAGGTEKDEEKSG